MRDLTVSAVAAALASTMRPCGNCNGNGNGWPENPDICDGLPCPVCNGVCEVCLGEADVYAPWLHVTERYEPGERVQIRAGVEMPKHKEWVGPWRAITLIFGVELNHPCLMTDDGLTTIPLRPGEVVATATVAECLPVRDGHPYSASVTDYIYAPGDPVRVLQAWINGEVADISECLVGQQWTAVMQCETCEGKGYYRRLGPTIDEFPSCPVCAGTGRRHCYGVRLEGVEVTA